MAEYEIKFPVDKNTKRSFIFWSEDKEEALNYIRKSIGPCDENGLVTESFLVKRETINESI